ncbi:hypothetical protein C3L23_03535 [Nautilia sp. PV-1]|uniref:hypothetical protein n=1 Tax=Nautilia sp. PV-1 TaxID=2579250 RepID=UPI000FD92F52|nr:hypothetical protein [Nautilia sp. PV-1]AZV46376.1 hypothetical protein C3L23_03535 [Nautilia sp. PV-1]
MKKKIGGFLIIAFLLSGCNLNFNSSKKPGVICDDKDAITLAEEILNQDILNQDIKNKDISPLKIDPENIVIWDYKSGRYLCKAKVTGKVLNKNFSTFLWTGSDYGIYEKNKTLTGWIYYQTYMTTSEEKKAKENKPFSFYVQIIPNKNIKEW